MPRLTLLLLTALPLVAACQPTGRVPREIPQAVWDNVPRSTATDEILQGPDGCFHYHRHGPLETLWVVVRDAESVPVCDPPWPRPETVN